jgi:hypothetical protein
MEDFCFYFKLNNSQSQLVNDHILRLLVKWQEGGLSQDQPEHQAYLQLLSSQVSIQLRSILDEIIEEDNSKVSTNKQVHIWRFGEIREM